jgi:hypothetical protein
LTANGGDDTFVRTFTITVTPVNDRPVAAADSYTVNEDTTLSVSVAGVLANDSDPNDTNPANNLCAILQTGPAPTGIDVGPAHNTGDACPANLSRNLTTANGGSVTLFENGSFTYIPALSFFGNDSFTYRLADDGGILNGGDDGNSGGASFPILATVTIAVSPVNDFPVNTLPATFTTNEDTSLVLSGISITDVDSFAADIRVTFSVPAGNGTLTVNTGLGAGFVSAVQVSGNGTNSVTVTAPRDTINNTLANATGLT